MEASAASEPILRWTPEEVWVMAGLAQRLLVATIDGVEYASVEGGRFHAEVHASEAAIEIALGLDGDAAKLALGARDPAGQRWRDAWVLEIARGDERWAIDGSGEAIEIADARRGPIVARLRVRRRVLVDGEVGEERVPISDVAFHKYTRQSTIVERDERAAASEPVPWMTPTRAETAPWWEIDLGKPMAIRFVRIDLAPLPAGTRLVCHAFGHFAPSGAPPAGSVVTAVVHDVDGQAWFTVDEPRVARYVRVQAHAADDGQVTLAITAAEIHAAELHAESLAQTMRRAFMLHADRTLCLARSPEGYVPAMRYRDMWARAVAIARGLAARLEPSEQRVTVAVMTKNRPEWIALDLAILERGYVSVALSPEDSDERLAQIFALAKPTCVVVEAANAERVTRLATTAKLVVTVEALDTLTSDVDTPPAPRSDDDLYAVLFTSGSTGMPKGAMRTYRTFNEMIASYAIGHSPRHLSFQPLSHLSERMYMPAILVNGGCIAFSRGGAHLVDELAALEPTTVGSVPRLWEVLHAGYARRVAADPDDEPRILRETRAQLGTQLLAVSVGSAPCSAEVLAWLRRCFADVWVSEGYGTTELGTIAVDGVIAKDVLVKLVPLPDAAPPTDVVERGEIWVKSPHVIAGYLGEATTTVDGEGFVATGDLGERDAEGRVRIVGRVRNTIKLAQGEFVSVDRVEAVLASCPAVDRIFVHAGYGSSHLAAVVVPREQGVDLAAVLREHARANGLASYEVPTEILVETEPFSVENGLLTASGKLARGALIAKYGARLGPATRPTVANLSDPPATRPTVADLSSGLAERIARIASTIAKRAISIDEPLGAGIGVDSLAAAEILAAISDDLDREVPLAWWFDAKTIADLAARLTGDTSHAAANVEMARADLALPTPPAPAIPASDAPVRRVLLTGATGFLGSFLVEALHARDIAATCLVRAANTADAQRRLDAALAAREIVAPATAIAGDLANLEIEVDVDAIVHAGATVSWLASYEALRAPNVHGTLALLARGLPFHHVSTISTVPPDGDETSTLAFDHVVHATPYALSKWVAEHHARQAGAQIYRPAMIAADTRRGIGNREDFLNRYLAGCAELGLFIDREDAVIDMTPVDFVADAIAACVAAGRRGAPLHLANIANSMTYATLGRSMIECGVAVKPASYAEFRAALIAHRESRLHPLLAFFPETFSLAMGPWPCTASATALAALGVQRPRIDTAYIARWLERERR